MAASFAMPAMFAVAGIAVLAAGAALAIAFRRSHDPVRLLPKVDVAAWNAFPVTQ